MRRPIEEIAETNPNQSEVKALCSTTVKEMPDGVVRVICPEHCKMKEDIWAQLGTEGYTGETPICLAAIHAGILRKGLFLLEKDTSQGKFVMRALDEEITEGSMKQSEVQALCDTTINDIPEGVVKVTCPGHCKMKDDKLLLGTDGYNGNSCSNITSWLRELPPQEAAQPNNYKRVSTHYNRRSD
ncbi:uncharacterized protein ACMZJ9_011740 [Mantella aurantiaca]